ncbi:MAG: isopeptide-forming domain-containing fimbrial protein [Pseudomonadota bacterium]
MSASLSLFASSNAKGSDSNGSELISNGGRAGRRFASQVALLFTLLLGAVSQAQAGEFCSTINGGNIDGSIPAVRAELATLTQITIDTDCTFSNFPQSDPLTVTVNFQTNDPSIYLIVFDNVYFSGNMACSNVDHKLWFVNGADYASGNSCQDLFIPVESIGKASPAATAAVGDPFTYTLKIPVMYDPADDIWYDTPSPNTIGNIKICDDLTDLIGPDHYEPADKATGADLTYISHTATLDGAPITLDLSPAHPTFCPGADGNKILYFSDANNADLTNLTAGSQIELNITVVLDNTAGNTVGSTFINNAEWWFARSIDLDENGIIEQATGPYDEITGTCNTGIDADGDGKCEYEFFEPLPGQSGAAARMAIDEPDFQVTKDGDQAVINIGDTVNYTVEAYNAGTVTAWDTEVTDVLPSGMCVTTDPLLTLSAQIFDSGGTPRPLTVGAGNDYTASYNSATCTLLVTMESMNAAVGPAETLVITYQSTLDDTYGTDGATLTNVAGTTDWYTADPEGLYLPDSGGTALTDGTPGITDDDEASYPVTAQLSGYVFTKTVVNDDTGEGPSLNISALPGDTLRYRLRLYNVDQAIDNITLTDILDTTKLNIATFTVVTLPTNATHNGAAGGTLIITGDGITPLSVSQGTELIIEFDIDVLDPLADTVIYNQATLIADAGFTATSDDPHVNGPSSPDIDGDEDETPVYVQSPNDLTKVNPADTTVSIGEEFTYTITVSAPTDTDLYDVVIHDDVIASAAEMEIVGVNDPSGQWVLSYDATSVWDSVTGIDVLAGDSATIEITMRLLNNPTNIDSLQFYNSAYYTYRRSNDTSAPQLTTNTVTTTDFMTVVESDLTTSTKSATYISPPTKTVGVDAATAGDVLQYTLTIPNTGNSTAYDVTVVDILPADVSLDTLSATASLYDPSGPTTTPIAGFVVEPDPGVLATGTAVWGSENTDGTLDVPVGQSLIITYEVTVASVTGSDITNAVHIDWSSLNDASVYERDGAGCPTVTAPDTYCYSPIPVTITTQDNTSLAKLVSDDSYAEVPASAGNPVVRVGDTVTYDLVLNLQEYTTQNVEVTDQLPNGMELVSYSYDHGTTTFNYTMVAEPTAPATGLLTWNFGDIENVPSGDATPVDPLVIRYVARVLHGVGEIPDPTPTTQTLTNDASLEYTGFDAANPALSANAPVDVLQPQITTLTKSATVAGPAATGSGTLADPYAVDIINNSMDFQLQVCNDGDAPAYGVVITDQLASELDETSVTAPVVNIDAAPALTGGVDYTYTAPASRPGLMTFTLDNTPLAPAACVNISYNVGFYTDTAPNLTWNNSATVTEYWSREAPANAREYVVITPVPASSIYMTNTFTPVAPTKTVASPLTGEVTIGESVSYTITVPGTPVNAELSDVVLSDTLVAALVYDASSVEVNGVPTAIVPVQSGQLLTWTIPTIPAGQVAEITLNAYVANSVGVDAGNTFANSASYTYDVGGVPTAGGSSDPLTATLLIIEPTVAMVKSVANQSNPGNPPVAGDVLRYTLQLDASGGAALDDFSDAFDISIIDDLSLGLAFQTGTATLNAAALADPVNVTGGDGITTVQQLRWSLADANADIDIPEGTSVTITYDVLVQNNVVAGQDLTNSAVGQWTGLDGVNANERDGSNGFGGEPNDYETAPQTTLVSVPDNTAFAKSVVADSDAATAVGTLRIGDTVDYRLDISLQEGTTNGISVSDTLDAGLEFDSIVSIDGDSVADYDPVSANFSYTTITAASLPTAGATGTLTFPIGDVVNTPDGNAANDVLTIIYRARVATGVLAQSPLTTLNNNALLTYNTTSTLNAAASVSVLQPVMEPITKLGNGAANTNASPLAVNVVTDTVQFTIESCNTTGLAPAYNVQLTDVLASQLDETSLVAPTVTINGAAATLGVDYTYTPPAVRGGSIVIDLIDAVNPGQCATAVYDIGFYDDFGPNELWSNSVTLDEYWSLDGNSGEQYTGSGPTTFWMTNSATIIPPSKVMTIPVSGEATIGESVVYQVTVPGTAANASLYDIVVTDTLAAELAFLSVSDVSGNGFTVTDNSAGNNLSFEISQIPAGQVAVLEITAQVANNADADAGDSLTNTASYTYATTLGGTTNVGGGDTTDTSLLIIEPTVTMSKNVANDSNPGNAPVAGDVLRYTLQLDAAGGANFSDAFDISIIDNLSLGLAYQPGTATLDAAALADPVNVTAGDGITTAQQLRWSLADGDDIDIPEGSPTVTITYDVLVLANVVAGQDLINSAVAQWTGLDGVNANERDGSNGFGVEPNDYETAPQTTLVSVPDNTAFAKSVVADSDAATAVGTLRIDDTVDYRLDITLQEGTTNSISVSDTLDAGLEFVGVVSIDGDTVANYDPVSGNFSYGTITAASLPTAGATALTFPIGDVVNTPDGNAANDVLTIIYRARVATSVLAQSPSTTLNNNALLTYNTTSTLNAAASVTVLQPVMEPITKLGNGAANTSASPLAVNVVTDTVQFTIESCNTTGLAPAYNVQLTDVLASQLDETSLVGPTVTINGAAATVGVDYTYTPPAVRGGSIVIDLIDAVNPGQCATAVYDIGFYDDFGPNELWSNSVTLDEYWSLDGNSGEQYTGSGPATFWMTNQVAVTPLSKSVVSPASEITVGEVVTYQIVVPATPVNAALDNVVVTDTLHGALLYQSDAAALFNSGAAVTLTDTSAGQDVTLGITQIPAGEQVTITFSARVDNNVQANAGVSFDNTAAYTYTGMNDPTQTQATSGVLTIIEPELAIGKTVTNTTNPGGAPVVGDILQYSVTFTASGGAAGDNFSDAFDLQIDDSLSLGLLYVTGTATVDGTGNTIIDPATNGGDGITTAQVLTWSLGDASADIDVVEGSTVTVTYNVEVLPTAQAGQDLTNSATVQWTGIDGASAFERDGSGAPVENDYFTGPATTILTTQFAVTFTKSVVNATTLQNPGDNASPGDTLEYTLVITNQSVAILTNGAVIDELAAQFEPNTLSVSVTGGGAYTDNSSGTGGANGTGIVDISNITLAPQGTAGDTVTIVFTATLASVIQSGTTVLNQGQLTGDSLPATTSNQTSTLIGSAPQFEVWKSSQDLTGDPAVLVPGDTLRYTITVNNVGSEDAVNAVLRDLVPVNTTYVANSTTLNGSPVADPVAGTSPLQSGMLINAPEDTTPGVMHADPIGATNLATITFDVVINDVFDGTVISNQGFVVADGAGTSGPVVEEPSDDPATATDDDPTLNVVGNVPFVDAQKLVELVDLAPAGTLGVVEPGDQLRYTITITNNGTTPATNVVFTDAVPAGTTYVAGSVELDGIAVADVAGVSPLVAGIPVSSSDLTPPLPTTGNGTISPGATATVTFNVEVTAATGVISNQGTVSLNQQVDEPTDFDGIDSNGDQPTTITVGAAQQLAITKAYAVLDADPAILPGKSVEFFISVTNTGTVPATDVVISDTVPANMSYVPGTARMLGIVGDADDTAAPLIIGDYASVHGDLLPGEVATLSFEATIDAGVADGTEIINTANVDWNAGTQTASATARLVVGGSPNSLSGRAWHDTNYDNTYDAGTESPLVNWHVDLYRNGSLYGTTLTGTDGNYTLGNIQPNDVSGDTLEIRFRAPGAGANTAALGDVYLGDVTPVPGAPFNGNLQRIYDITLANGDVFSGLNLPITPNGVVYESYARTPVAGATLTMLDGGTGAALPPTCFDDPLQQGQTTLTSGYYKFDLNFTDAACPQGGEYVISVTPPASGFDSIAPSRLIPPESDPVSGLLLQYDVPTCPADAVTTTVNYCEMQPLAAAPQLGDVTTYYLRLTLDNPQPENSQLFNNHIPLDPELTEAVPITKRSARVNVSRGDLVPYTITVNNSYLSALQNLTIIDTFPAGFKYVEGSSRYDGVPLEPTVIGNQLHWENIDLASGVQHTIQLVFIVGAGVAEGEYINRAGVIDVTTGDNVSGGEATATVRVVPDPTFDCTDIIGKVFDDKNLNGHQDEGETGLPGTRLVTARGLIVTSDEHGRFHITCAMVPNESRGSNFILKLDDRSLPTGYRVISENPRVQRLTRGKMAKFNFAATIHHVVRLDVADGVFEPGTTTMREQWRSRIGLLLDELRKAPSVLRISYLADVEREGLVDDRTAMLKEMIGSQWEALDCCYKLTIESEVFWRRGAPPERSGVID